MTQIEGMTLIRKVEICVYQRYRRPVFIGVGASWLTVGLWGIWSVGAAQGCQ